MEKLKNYMISFGICIISNIILLSLGAAIFAYTNISDRYLQMYVFGTIVISVLISTIMLTKKTKEKGLLYGGIFGIAFVLLLFLVTSIAYSTFNINNTLLLYLGISFLSGIVGGIIGVNV